MGCPKCHGDMHTMHRSGLTIEVCHQCGGVFLDYGELEHLIAAEGRHYATPPPMAYEQPHHRGGFLSGILSGHHGGGHHGGGHHGGHH